MLTTNDNYCQLCISTPSMATSPRLSCFTCDHCRLSMCYDCFKKHTTQLIDEYSQIQKRYSHLTDLCNNKRQLLRKFEDHCIRSVDATFNEVLNDLHSLRKESLDYVRQQFKDSQNVVSDMINNIQSLIDKSQHSWLRDGITRDSFLELNSERKQISEIECNFHSITLPNVQIKMSTYPTNKLNLDCQLLSTSYDKAKGFCSFRPTKIITTKCLCHESAGEPENENIDISTEVEQLYQDDCSTKQIQTDSLIEHVRIQNTHNSDDENIPDGNIGAYGDNDGGYDDDNNDDSDDEANYFSLQEDQTESSNSTNVDHGLSKRYSLNGIISTQYNVDRIASDGEHLLYFSDSSKLLCYIRHVSSGKRINPIIRTKEITCRWPHNPILDLVYSPAIAQFICATKYGVYSCCIDSDNDDSTIDIQSQIIESWSYVRLSIDNNFLWLWTDTPNSSELRIYSPRTFECIRKLNLSNYSCFSDNSTSFCTYENLIATLFQFKETTDTLVYKKKFHLSLCDHTDLRELCTIYLGTCDIDHEIRTNNDGIFFITNGKRKLWIVDRYGHKEHVKLNRTGRALAVHAMNEIIIANGTKQLQRIEFIQNTSKYV